MAENTLENIALEFGKAFVPLKEAVSSLVNFRGLMLQLGWDEETIPAPIEELLADVLQLIDTIQQVSNDSGNAENVQKIVASVHRVVQKIKDLESVTFSPEQMAENFHTKFPVQLIEYLLIEYLTIYQPKFGFLFKAFGIIKYNYEASTANRPEHVGKELNFTNLPDLFTDPIQIFENAYGWRTVDLDYAAVNNSILELMNAMRISAFIDSVDDEIVSKVEQLPSIPGQPIRRGVTIPIFSQGSPSGEIGAGLTLFGLRGDGPKLPGLALIPYFSGSVDKDFEITNNLFFTIETDLNIQGGVALVLRPQEGLSILSGFDSDSPTTLNGALKLKLANRNREGTPIFIFGSADGSNFQYKSLSVKTIARLELGEEPEIFFELELEEAKVEIKAGEGDSFIQKILPEDGIGGTLNLALGISSVSGFYFRGSAGLEIEIPTHVDLGIVEFIGLKVALKIEPGKVPVELGASIKANLGPLQAVVENIGIRATFSFPNDNSGNLGPLDLDLGFKPPNGVGLSVDAGVVKGGGYLYFDYDREEYAGALELVFSEWIALKAVGLITTRLPDGSKGFSMVIIISVEFGSGLQLGFGFTLLGVGGILGINRTVNIDAMSEGVRSGAIESVMFPENIVANAPKIISDLRQFFPALNDQFLIGPMAKIGYGTPTLISLSLGVIIEFPDVNITILGILKVALPTEEASVIKLQVNFLGRIEPSNNLLWFHAFLFDSRILFITLEGGMGLLVNWGDNSNFVVSVGGFHPRFNPPPLPFPAIPRIAVNILNESMARIRIEGYFAVTSNTVQFGARAELFFGFSAINVQGHLGFDALFQFSPFYFIFEFSLGLSVQVFGFGLFSIDISGLLEGPAKWHIEGTAKWKITWFGPTIRININETWGEERQTELPPIEAFPLLEREFAAITNWEAVVPKQSSLLVALRKLGDEESEPDSEDMDTRPLVLHPVGTLRISQRKIPLKLRLDKIGSQQPSDVNEFSVTANLGGGGSLAQDNVREKFARGEFQELDKATKLSSPAFEKYESGLTVSADGDALQTSMAVKRIIRYETIIIDNLFKRKAIAFFKQLQLLFSTVFATLFSHFLNGNAVTRSALSFKQQKQLQPNKEVIKIIANQYSVAFNDTNKPVNAIAAQFKSQAEAMDYLRRQRGENAATALSMHVIPNTEVNQAA